MDALGIERFVISGHSMGGSIGLDYALHYPGVEALILLGAAASWAVPQELLDLFRNDPEEGMRRGKEINFAKDTPLAIRGATRAKQLDHRSQHDSCGFRSVQCIRRAGGSRQDRRPDLHRLR